jgi:predicted ATPase/class 3 adenylate cyclase
MPVSDTQARVERPPPPGGSSPGRAVEGTAASRVILGLDDCELDLAAHIFVNCNGQELRLTRAEVGALSAFIASPRQVLSRDQLSRAAGGRGTGPYERRMDMLIARLRRKIEPNPMAPRFIVTVPGAGYRLSVNPQTLDRLSAAGHVTIADAGSPGGVEERASAQQDQDAPLEQAEAERRQVTALSCVLVGLSAMAIRLDPEETVDIIRRFQDMCSAVIAGWGGGVVSSLRGSGNILALFGHPKSHEDDAERAVHAALELLEKVGDVALASGERLELRCAISTGLVVVAADQTAIGEATLIARQLRNLAPPNSVIVTARTRKLLNNAFVCADRQLFELKDVSEPVTAYRVTGKRASKSRLDARSSGRYSRFVGRQQQLQQMTSLWERVKAGSGQVLLVCGEPGIGKSRLCRAWLERIADDWHFTLRIQGSPYHTNSPFYSVIDRLMRSARLKRVDGPQAKVKKLETVLSQAGTDTLVDTPLFAALLSIPARDLDSNLKLNSQRQRDLTITAMLRQVLGLAVRRPVVMKVSDAHWLDFSTLEFINRCINSIRSARVFVLCTFRPEFFPQWLDQSHVSMLRLDRLSREETGIIVSDVAGEKDLPDSLREHIMSKADGIPLFAEELTKSALEGELQQSRNGSAAVSHVSSFDIPATLLGSLSARLDRLGPNKEIAQIAAVIGREFSYRVLAAVARVSGSSLQAALAHIAASELIFAGGEPPDATYIFKHALIQDAAYATMVRSKRQKLHSRIADALIAEFPETADTQPELIAYHLDHAGRSESAIEYLRKAAQRAIERSANAEAIGHLTGALELLRSAPDNAQRNRATLELEIMLGQTMISRHGYAAAETEATFLRARALIDEQTEPAQKFATLYGLFACYYVGGQTEKQRAAAHEFLMQAERAGETAALCIAHRMVGTTCMTTGELSAGLHHLERACALYDPQQHLSFRFQYGQDIGVAALCYLSWAQWHLGHLEQGLAVAAEAMRRGREVGHPHTLVYALCHAGCLLDLFRSRCEDIGTYADEVSACCAENGFWHWANCGRIFKGWAEICAGDVEHGIEMLRAAIAAWQERGARLWVPFFLSLEAQAWLKAGRAAAALEAIERALTTASDTGERWATAELLRVKARALHAAGETQPGDIESLLLESLKLAREQKAMCWQLRAARDLARLWQQQGRTQKALALLRPIHTQFSAALVTADLQDTKALLQSLRRSAGRKWGNPAGKKSGKTRRT